MRSSGTEQGNWLDCGWRLSTATGTEAVEVREVGSRFSKVVTKGLLGGVLLCFGCGGQSHFEREHEPFLDLVAGLGWAEVLQEVSEIDLGTQEARRHLVRGWSKDEVAGTTFVWSYGEASVVEFYLAVPRNLEVTLRCRPLTFENAPPQDVSVSVNGFKFAVIELGEGFADYRLSIPESLTLAGRNHLQFGYRYAETTAAVLPGAEGSRPLAVAWDWIRFEGLGRRSEEPSASVGASREALYLPLGSRVDYHFPLPGPVTFTVSRVDLRPRDGTARLRVLLQVDGTEESILAELDSSTTPQRLEISGPTGRIARLSLVALPAKASSQEAAGARLVRPRLELPFAVGAAMDDSSDGRGGETLRTAVGRPSRPNVIIYLIDTLRRDHLGCYGYQLPTSPHIDAFAGNAVLFEDAIAESPWTRASVATLFTGLWPPAHTAVDRNDALPEATVTLAEHLRDAGYHTAAFVTNGNISDQLGFGQGFREFHNPRGNSGKVNETVLPWLESAPEHQPFLLYVHTVDPHSPYKPPEKYRRLFAPRVKEPHIGTVDHLKDLAVGKEPVIPGLREKLVNLYDASIAYNDHNFGQLLAALKSKGLYEESLILLVSDHGEEFHEHGGWEHGRTLYAEIVEIPFIIKLPGGFLAGQRVKSGGQLSDVLPLILELAQIEIPANVQGSKYLLRALSTSLESPPPRIRSFIGLDGRQGVSIIEDQWKIIDISGVETYTELYRRGEDPRELRDLFMERSVVGRYLRGMAKMERSSLGSLFDPRKAEMDEGLKQHLKSLGYLR